MTAEPLGHAHLMRVCQHDVVVLQCRCVGPKTKVLVPCPPSCELTTDPRASRVCPCHTHEEMP